MSIPNSLTPKVDIKTIDIEYLILGSIIVDNTLAYNYDDISSNMCQTSTKKYLI